MKIFKRPIQLLRLTQINIILMRNRLDTVVLSTKPFQSYSFLSYLNPWGWFRPKKPRGEALRIALEELGPVFVKFGQILSTRRDLLPGDMADELEKLQDSVPPFPGVIAQRILEREYNRPVQEVFASFDLVPFASASVAQVHAATLQEGTTVVVKILRPNIEKVIFRDISLLSSFANLTSKFLPHGDKLKLREVVHELERSMRYELDLLHEGANASQLRRNFLNSDLLYIPEVFWEYSSKDILVMERIDGIPISDIATLKAHNVDLKKLAENGVEIFFTQVLRDSFFHADMHPGNIFVSKDNPQKPKYIAVDFGIMGTLSPKDQRYLAENLLAFFRRDYRRVAELHVESGWVDSSIRLDEFETAIRGVSEPIFERPFKDISFGKLLLKLFQAAREFHMEIQPQFFLLQKTLLNIEGLGRQLYPELDLWSTAQPYLERWVRQQFSPKTVLTKIYNHGPQWIDQILELPGLMHARLAQETVTESRTKITTTESNKTIQRKKWLGLGAGVLIMVIVNFITTHFTTDTMLVVNSILGIVAILLIVFGV